MPRYYGSKKTIYYDNGSILNPCDSKRNIPYRPKVLKGVQKLIDYKDYVKEVFDNIISADVCDDLMSLEAILENLSNIDDRGELSDLTYKIADIFKKMCRIFDIAKDIEDQFNTYLQKEEEIENLQGQDLEDITDSDLSIEIAQSINVSPSILHMLYIHYFGVPENNIMKTEYLLMIRSALDLAGIQSE